MGGVLPMSSLVSRCPFPELRSVSRRDVYYSGDWIDQTSPVAWYRRGDLELERDYARDGVAFWPDGTVVDRDYGEDTVLAQAMRGDRLAVLGAVDQWRTMTIEQAAAVAGVPLRAAQDRRVLSAMCSAGLLDWGVSVSELRSRRRVLPHLPFVRPARSGAFDRLIAPEVTYGELVAVTAGMEFGQSRQFDRHNVLSTELGLRAAEFLPQLATVVGEKMARTDLLLPLPSGSQAGGDLVLVRQDGLRIVVELTATVAKSFREKVERWASLLSRHSLASSGVVVLFVDASQPSEDGDRNLQEIRKQVSMHSASYPGVPGVSVADRMFAVSWRDLFPAAHSVSEGFMGLEAWCPAGPVSRGQRWLRRSLLDEDQVRLPSSEAQSESLAALAVSSRMLAGTPFWMRSSADVGVWNTMLERVGVDRVPLRPAQTSRRRADGSWGYPEGVVTDPGELSGIGGRAVPRLASRGLPVVPRSKVVRVRGGETSSPAWSGFSFTGPAAPAVGQFASFASFGAPQSAVSGAGAGSDDDLLDDW